MLFRSLKKLKLYNKQEQSKELRDKDIKKRQFCLLGLLSQGHNIIVHIYGTVTHKARFKQLVGRMILINNRTRWNS